MPQDKTKTESFGGHKYTFYMLDPFVASDMLQDLISIVSPLFGALASSAGTEKFLDLEPAQAGSLFAELMDRMTKEKKNEMMQTLLEVTHVDGKPLKPIAAVHFHGEPGNMHQWFYLALRCQFDDFFEKITSALRQSGILTAQESPLPNT